MLLRLAFAVTFAAGSGVLTGTASAQMEKMKPAGSVVVTNARAVPATSVSIGAGTKTVSIAKPLAPNGRTTLRLPRMTGCMVSVAATFADESVVEEEIDVCKENTVRFTE
jgi:hypothetical protein